MKAAEGKELLATSLGPGKPLYGAHMKPRPLLRVEHMHSGTVWEVQLTSRAIMDLTTQVKRWIRHEYSGSLVLDGRITPNIEGAYYASLHLYPGTRICWGGGGFYLKER